MEEEIVMKIVDDALFQHACGTMMGATSSQILLPESVHPWAVKELEEVHHATLKYIGIDNNPVYHEPMVVYRMTLPEDEYEHDSAYKNYE
jgi:hypothetical protein